MRLEVHASCFGSFQNKMCLLLDLVLPGATCSSQGGPGTERTESRVFLHFESWGVSAYSCRWGRRVRLMPLHLWRRTLKKAHKECSPHPNGRIHDCTQELGLCQIKYNQYICEFFVSPQNLKGASKETPLFTSPKTVTLQQTNTRWQCLQHFWTNFYFKRSVLLKLHLWAFDYKSSHSLTKTIIKKIYFNMNCYFGEIKTPAVGLEV